MTDLEIAKRLVRTEQSATNREYDFDLTFNQLKKLLHTKRCYITGVPLQTEHEQNPDYLTLERLDNDLGYVHGNVVACSLHMNKRKANLTVLEIEQMYEALRNKGIL